MVKARLVCLYWERQCMNYAPPPDQIVLRSGEDDLGMCAKDSRYRISPNSRNPSGGYEAYVYYVPAVCDQLKMCIPKTLSFGKHAKFGDYATRNHSATAYLHQRFSPDGAPVLVAVEVLYQMSFNSGSVKVEFMPRSFSVGHLWTNFEGTFNDSPLPDIFFAQPPAGVKLTVFAGQSDLNDRSHFTIRYRANEQEGVIDGHVNNDGSVKLTAPDRVVKMYLYRAGSNSVEAK